MDVPRYVFGPVASGRLGLSLGLDLLGARVCTFDCLYCEVGPTDALTLARKPYVKAERLLAELHAVKAAGGVFPDAVTLGGLGEPCLNTEFGQVIAGAKEIFPGVPTAVLTNSSLLPDPAVRAALADADIVLPSMDTLVPREFSRLNRPHPDLSLAAVAQGLLDFRAGFGGRIYLEILLIKGINDTEENLALLRDYCARLKPERIDVVTMTRPGAHEGAQAATPETLARFEQALRAKRHRPSPAGHGPAGLAAAAAEELTGRIAASLKRRPQTVMDLVSALGAPEANVRQALTALEKGGIIRREHIGGDIFYSG